MYSATFSASFPKAVTGTKLVLSFVPSMAMVKFARALSPVYLRTAVRVRRPTRMVEFVVSGGSFRVAEPGWRPLVNP